MERCYEDKLREFAEGKRLGRLAKYVRDQAGSICDACGSTLPRMLFALRDGNSGRYYFVGQNCLGWLLTNRLVARARYRQSAVKAYELEMAIRRNGGTIATPAAKPTVETPREATAKKLEPSPLQRTVLIIQSDSSYRAQVRLGDGHRSVVARAREPRWRPEWVHQEGGLLFQEVCRPRPAALAICVLRAYREALGLWRTGAARSGDGTHQEAAA